MSMTTEQLIEDFKVMIKADTGHLIEALKRGDRTQAHQFVDAIIDTKHEVEDLFK